MSASSSTKDLLAWTTQIVSAQVRSSNIPAGELAGFIESVFRALQGLALGKTEGKPNPAVPVKRSITPDYIICLEDGRKLKMLKRHLSTAYALTPDQYRTKWDLPPDYPMVAPNYAAHRSILAKKIGLGRRTRRR